VAAIVLLPIAAAGAGAQAPPPTFPSKVELITVDVVVLDQKGQPVPGLTREDFVVEEDGRAQPIVSFEAMRLEAPAAEAAPGLRPVVATNQVDQPRLGRAFAIVLDDLGLELADAAETRRAVAGFLENSVQDGDEVTLATTSADAWWSARIPEGREDLAAVARRLRSRVANASNAADYVSDYEAFWIENRSDFAAAPVMGRVIKRWTDNKVCFERDPGCGDMVKAQARAVDAQRAQRMRATLETVRRALLSLGPVRGRKSLLLFSRGFIEDGSSQIRSVIAASRETNTAVFFLDAQGLTTSLSGSSPMSASAAGMPDVTQLGRMHFEEGTLGAAGAMSLADETGGFSIRNTNDLAAGAERVAAESRVFYMLGFEPPAGKKPGDWRKLRVKVTRDGLSVRARRGYTVRAEAAAPGKSVPTREGTRTLPAAVETALDTAHDVTGIALRAVTYVLDPREKDTTHVMLAAEFDASPLTFEGSGKSRTARLEVTAAATLRDTGKTFYSDERVEVRVPEGEPPGWRSVAREFDLPAGIAQARLIVRDPATGAMGAVAQRFEVPAAGSFRLSTPIVSDQVIPAPAGGKPRAAVAAHRVFAPGGGLYCEFEVFGAARDAAGPRVSSGLELRSGDGTLVRQAPPTRIAADRDGRVVRLVGLGLEGLAEGQYELVLEVTDEVGGGRIERREPFTIGRPPARQAAGRMAPDPEPTSATTSAASASSRPSPKRTVAAP
jgi:VWFA-related protein